MGWETDCGYHNAIAEIDTELEKAGAMRIGARGEDDNDKNVMEDYPEWKDGMWDAFSRTLGVEDQGNDTAASLSTS